MITYNVKKINEIFFLFFIIIFSYLSITFSYSFINISNYVSNGNDQKLNRYILEKNLKKSFYIELEKYFTKNLDTFSKKFILKDDNLTISGNFSDAFILKIFSKTIDSISTDFSKSIILLYFYENSNEINNYFEKYLINFGDYSFQEYLFETSTKDEKKILELPQEVKTVIEKEEPKENFFIKIKRLKDKFKSIDYFFFISPLHFKLSVKHQDIPFVVIFNFNGINWKINNIIFNYEDLIEVIN